MGFLFILVVGVVAGFAAGLDALAMRVEGRPTPTQIMTWGAGGAVGMAAALWLLRRWTAEVVGRSTLSCEGRARVLRWDLASYPLALVTWAGAAGVQFTGATLALAVLGFVVAKGAILLSALRRAERRELFSSMPWLAFLFLVSGFAALIYQIVWQRSLYAAFGVNIESITVIVSLFMAGLGVGSFVGGAAANRWPGQAPVLFLICELGIGLFGVASLPLIHAVSRMTIQSSPAVVTLVVYALLALPTMLMGATLPILVGHLYRHYRNVGKSVGLLYCINTLGSAAACFLTADLLFVLMGQGGAVLVAAACNLAAGILVARYATRVATPVGVAA